jgi:putative ABC transport system permease protein
MGRLLLIGRLAARDLRHRPAQAVLLLIAIAAGASTLTVALALNGAVSQPYAQTRAATAGPDVVAAVQTQGQGNAGPLSQLTALEHSPGVTGSSGPFLLAFPTTLAAGGHSDPVIAEGRDSNAAPVDQPKLVSGGWVRGGGVVVERSLADLLDLKVGQWVSLGVDGQYGVGGPGNMRRFEVTGIAVTAVIQPSPISSFMHPSGFAEAGLVWVTKQTAAQLASDAGGPLGYTLNLRLANPAAAPAFAAAHQSGPLSLISWQSISAKEGLIISIEQAVLLTGSSLLGLLALASVALLVGGRMEEQTRRVGLLKAAGAMPGLVTGVLLAEQLVLAVAGAGVGLLIGWLTAPLLTNPGASLLGAPGAPAFGLSTVGIVIVAAVAVASVATIVPAIRASRVSTVSALADSARSPRRGALSIRISAWLPVPFLLGLRLASRRRRRALLSAASIAVTVGALVAVLMFRQHAQAISSQDGLYRFSGPGDPLWQRAAEVMAVFTVALVILALVNAVLVTWATVQDARHTSAVDRALGASPGQVSLALVVAQLIPALPGAVLGIPVGVGLYVVAGRHNSTLPAVPVLLAVLLLTMAVVALLTAIPARIGARRPIAEILQAETA